MLDAVSLSTSSRTTWERACHYMARIRSIISVIGNRGHSGRMSRLLHDDSPLDTAPCARWLYRSRRTTLAMSARDTRMTSSRPPSLLRWRPFTYAAQGGRDWSRRQTQGGRHVAHPGGGRRPRGCEASEETAGNALESSWLRSGLYAPHSVAQRRVGRTLEPQSKRRIMGRAQEIWSRVVYGAGLSLLDRVRASVRCRHSESVS